MMDVLLVLAVSGLAWSARGLWRLARKDGWNWAADASVDVVWHLDLKRRNGAVSERFWDWVPELRGDIRTVINRAKEFVRPGDWETLRRAVARAAKGQDTVLELEFRALLPGQGERWLRLKGRKTGSRQQWIGSLSDVTELKELRTRLSEWTTGKIPFAILPLPLPNSPIHRLGSRLRTAIDEQRLTLVYQPQIRLSDRRVIGFEALARWTDEELGPVSPSDFIPAAEQMGLISRLGDWALSEACSFLASSSVSVHHELSLAVNVSVMQLKDPSFAARAERLVREAGVDPGSIELEITETVLIPSLDDAVTQLSRLRDLGFRIALDDFGQGYSSLSYLKALPLDTLKIDKVFMDGDPGLLSTIIRLGRLLYLRVVAEGVESARQLAPLMEQGCDIVQGYYFSLPMEAEEARRFLEAETPVPR